jgi:hypothetical protein
MDTSMLLLQHINVAGATYECNTRRYDWDLLRYSENDSGPGIGFEEIASVFPKPVSG